MLVQNVVTTVSGRKFRAMHSFRLTQVLNVHGTPVAVIDYVAAHGFCMTESVRHRREQYFVKLRLHEHLISLAWRAAVIPGDNDDFKATCDCKQ